MSQVDIDSWLYMPVSLVSAKRPGQKRIPQPAPRRHNPTAPGIKENKRCKLNFNQPRSIADELSSFISPSMIWYLSAHL